MKLKLAHLLSFVLVFFVFVFFPFTSAFAEEAEIDMQGEYAIFPASTMNLSQLAYESYSHHSQNAIDILPNGNVFAPFTGEVIYKDPNWGYVVLQSVAPVYWADGSFDYMTVGFMHDNDISDIKIGDIINQGDEFYQAGGTGWGDPNAFGAHVHIAVFRGKPEINNSNGSGDSYAYEAFFISDKTEKFIGKGKGYVEPGNYTTNNAPDDYSDKWKDISYLNDCTFYQSIGTVKITKNTYIKALPCSKKTNSASVNVIHPKNGSIYNVTGLYMNSAGNYWYRITFDDCYGFLFAGDAKFTNYQVADRNAHSFFSITGADLWCYEGEYPILIRTK